VKFSSVNEYRRRVNNVWREKVVMEFCRRESLRERESSLAAQKERRKRTEKSERLEMIKMTEERSVEDLITRDDVKRKEKIKSFGGYRERERERLGQEIGDS